MSVLPPGNATALDRFNSDFISSANPAGQSISQTNCRIPAASLAHAELPRFIRKKRTLIGKRRSVP